MDHLRKVLKEKGVNAEIGYVKYPEKTMAVLVGEGDLKASITQVAVNDARKHVGDEAFADAIIQQLEEKRKELESFREITRSYEAAAEHLLPMFVGITARENVQRTYVSGTYLDMVYAVAIALDGVGRVLLQKDHAKMWGVSECEIIRRAMENLVKLQVDDCDMVKKMFALTENIDIDEIDDDLLKQFLPTDKFQRIVSTNIPEYGANVLLNRNYMLELHKKYGDCIVIPSSIHEILLLPLEECITSEEIRAMVVATNETEVDEKERLSDHGYLLTCDGVICY